MTYWDMQVHPGSRREDFPVGQVLKLLEKSHCIGMGDGWKNDLGQPEAFRNEMAIGDVVVVRDGGEIAALVRVTGECKEVPASRRTDLVWYGLAREVEIVSTDVESAEARYLHDVGLAATYGMSLRRTLNRCRKSEFARYWYTKVCGRKEPSFTWVPFFKELADCILGFRHNRAELLSSFSTAFKLSNTGLEIPHNGRGKRVSDLDPFSFFALLNRKLNEDKKRRLMGAVGTVFKIKAECPQDFNGIPHADNRRAYFFGLEGDPTKEIDTLWAFFATALLYADHPGQDLREQFAVLFDQAETQKGVGRNLTMGLFWIRPESYVGLDARNIGLIFESGQFSEGPVSKYKDLAKDLSSGSRYLEFRDVLLRCLAELRYPDFVTLSHEAYLQRTEYEHSERLKEQAQTEAASVEDACRKPVKALLRSCKNGREFQERVAEVYKARKIRSRFPELNDGKLKGTEKVVQATQRVGQSIFRDAVLDVYEQKCCISGLPIVDLLEACHILGWKEAEQSRLSPENGLCMAVIYHRAFDRHLIAIDDDYRLVISPGLKRVYSDAVCKEFFYRYENKRIFVPKKYPPNRELLRQHRALLKT